MTYDDLDTIALNSYKNFHTKGLDYICLLRRPELTLKAYFFEGDVTHLPEIVIPHNHRYAFTTFVLAGEISNHTFRQLNQLTMFSSADEVYQEFDYLTPLNGGDGFTWKREVALKRLQSERYTAGKDYHSKSTDLHTLQIHTDSAVALLAQFHDEVEIGVPTQSYRPGLGHGAPSLDGLYEHFNIGELETRLKHLKTLGI